MSAVTQLVNAERAWVCLPAKPSLLTIGTVTEKQSSPLPGCDRTVPDKCPPAIHPLLQRQNQHGHYGFISVGKLRPRAAARPQSHRPPAARPPGRPVGAGSRGPLPGCRRASGRRCRGPASASRPRAAHSRTVQGLSKGPSSSEPQGGPERQRGGKRCEHREATPFPRGHCCRRGRQTDGQRQTEAGLLFPLGRAALGPAGESTLPLQKSPRGPRPRPHCLQRPQRLPPVVTVIPRAAATHRASPH